jgi:type III pantothenate kinase
MSVQGLFTRTARLPLVDFKEPERLVGSNTVASMQAGLYYGVIGMIDGILERLTGELGTETKCIATGGQAELIVRGSHYLKTVDADLTLEGLQQIWQRNHSR